MPRQPLDAETIGQRLDACLEVEFSFYDTGEPAAILGKLGRGDQDFVLNWVRRAASTNLELAYRFALQAPRALQAMDRHMIEAWLLQAMERYDRSGLRPAMEVIGGLDDFVRHGRERASGAVFEEESGVLLHFLHGLAGRPLNLKQDERVYTDTETLFLPAVVARLPRPADNFRLYKAMVAHLWAQTRFGSFRVDLLEVTARYPDPDKALALLHALETLRLDACIARELPGLYRDMGGLRNRLEDSAPPKEWRRPAARLRTPAARARDSVELLAKVYAGPVPKPACYQGCLDPAAVAETLAKRIEREKAFLRVRLSEIADEMRGEAPTREAAESFSTRKHIDPSEPDGFRMELTLDQQPLPVPQDVQGLMNSIVQDLGDIPHEYLNPAGPGEYDLGAYAEQTRDPSEVWSGTYHEEGAHLHHEWDHQRLHYRKNWCVVRELDVPPRHNGFVAETLRRHAGVVKSLSRTFEALRGEDKLLKRQVDGDGVDIDAVVEAHADVLSGLEMTDRLFTRMLRVERDIAVMFMVDMSGSTRGWVNDAEREALALLCQSLETLGDRYAIYGFSGVTRKRCELYRVKEFDEPYDDEVRARISGIEAKDYTRMGVAIRHLSMRLHEVEARTKLLVTLSDGKPEDYDGYYRGEYGVEDTRQALYEARRDGIHAYCITIDQEARDYLPHMYGAANYAVIDDVRKLPFKVSDIYRRLTS